MIEPSALLGLVAFLRSRGRVEIEAGQFVLARDDFISAAEAVLKIAQQSNGVYKARRLKKARELYALAREAADKEADFSLRSEANRISCQCNGHKFNERNTV